MFRIIVLCIVMVSLNLNAIELIDKTKKIARNSQGLVLSKDGKPIYEPMGNITVKPIQNITIKSIQNITIKPMGNITVKPIGGPIIYCKKN